MIALAFDRLVIALARLVLRLDPNYRRLLGGKTRRGPDDTSRVQENVVVVLKKTK